ncbi:MAG: hypothetical protein QF709_04190 [Candidatus Thalassarchaeum sp.]|nr:hypothetical protein [Candidatus Thalassarchaeum sp.]
MSRRATLTAILTAMLLLMVPYAVLATDSDGDGTDDADDDFPNNPCADTDTDGDGLPDTVVSGCTSQSVVAYTSFEDPFTISSVKYTDTGSDSVSRYLWNNANEPHIAHNQTTGAEMGFTLYYTSTGGVGLTDGDYFGTVNYTGTVGNFTDGTKGYQMSDVDGIATLALDDVIAESLSFDFFLQDTGYETSNPEDYLVIRFVGANSDIEIINTTGYDIDTDNSSWLGTWTTMIVMIGAAGNGHLEVEFSSNAGTEALYLDNIQFTATVALSADTDDDGDGWSDVDEADCGTDPLDGNDVPADADANGICDALEGDDFDGDGIPNDSDPDDDNDGVDDVDDDFPLNPNETTDTDGDGVGDNADEDDDNDGWMDENEDGCGTDPLDGSSVPSDYDGDSVCDPLDADDDNDGADDADDEFPLDETEWKDTDGDGIGDNTDEDDDNDGWSDAEEDECGTNPRAFLSIPFDTDDDGTCDSLDEDDDNDGWLDSDESACGTNQSDAGSVPSDVDSDGDCDALDEDTDNDGWSDSDEEICGSDAMDSDSVPADQDGDSECDAVDSDVDGDGHDNEADEFPEDASEWVDSDGDGTGDNADADDDNDGVDDDDDEFPYDDTEWVDTDGDGIGNNADADDDRDGWSDDAESDCGSDGVDEDSVPADFDGDGQCDDLDPDDDGDGVADSDDAMPNDQSEWDDTDGDGMGDNADLDDDNDGWSDAEEGECGADQYDSDSTPTDYDNNGVCDANDPVIEPEPEGTPGFGLISALAMLALAAFARRD